MTSVRRSLLISVTEKYLLVVLQLVSFVVLARLLRPEDVGVYSVAAALVGVAQVVRDFGVASYLVQEKHLTPEKTDTAATVMLLVSWSLGLLVLLAAGPLAAFYRDERLREALMVMAAGFALVPFGAVRLALLRRALAFGKVFWINLAASVANIGLGILLAWWGFAHMSLVWAWLASIAVTSALAVALERGGRLLPWQLAHWREVLGFGGRVTASSVVAELAVNVNDLVIGRVLGFGAVGYLNRALGVMNLFHRDFMAAIRNVAFPAFARARRQGEDVEAQFIHSLTLVTVVAWPFYGFLALYPAEVLALLFGPQWAPAAELVPVFCLAGAVASLWNLIQALLNALGRADLTLRGELLVQPVRVAALVAAALWFNNLLAYACAFAAIYAYSVPVLYRLKDRALPTRYRALARGLGHSLLVAAGTLAVPAAFALARQAGQLAVPPLALLGLGLVTAFAWVALLWATRHPLINDPALTGRLPWLARPRAT